MITRILTKTLYQNTRNRVFSISKMESFSLVGLGNPLLDISAHVKPNLLEKYDLLPDNAYLAAPKHEPLYDEIVRNYEVEYTAGGDVQNALRVCQWILQQPNVSVFFGCVGNDNYAKILKQKAIEDGVSTCYQISSKAPTGTCAVLINGTERTLVANLAAAEHFTLDFLIEPKHLQCVESALFYYISGYFLTVCTEAIVKVAQHACDCNKPFFFNLSAIFVSEFYIKDLDNVLPFVDVLIGNKQEIESFAHAHNWNCTDLKEIGQKIQSLPKSNENRSRIVIITQGPSPVIIFDECSIVEYRVPVMEMETIVDTNGAGDAFVGGFLAQYMQEKPVERCVRCGIYAAQHIISQSGCTFNGKPDFKDKNCL